MTTVSQRPFTSPSFKHSDIVLLLSTCTDEPVTVEEKEALVASGGHYSEVFVKESPPSEALLKAFNYALYENKGAERLAQHIQYLVSILVKDYQVNKQDIILISLVRAGVPLAILLKRYLDRYHPTIPTHHYGISIIRGKGIDSAALEYIDNNHQVENAYFVDGWTGKGSISQELKEALLSSPLPFQYRLIVDSDPAGTATLSATEEDWLIPFGLIGAPISGLFSRTLWADTGYHKAAIFNNLLECDLSGEFFDAVEGAFTPPATIANNVIRDGKTTRPVADIINQCLSDFDLESPHKIKPGIAEATRATHRRTPQLIILKARNQTDTTYIEQTAKEKGIPIQIGLTGGMGPFKAITILK
jgi:hypothetical protein